MAQGTRHPGWLGSADRALPQHVRVPVGKINDLLTLRGVWRVLYGAPACALSGLGIQLRTGGSWQGHPGLSVVSDLH